MAPHHQHVTTASDDHPSDPPRPGHGPYRYGSAGTLIPMAGAPKPASMREAIADSIASNLKSYDVAAFCVRIGLAAQRDGEDPFRSRRVYVRTRLQDLGLPELVTVARAVLTEWDDDTLQDLVDRARVGGVAGELKNLIFASTGPKPKIVLRDALNNIIEITEGARTCLVYDRPLTEEGLTWGALVGWWAAGPLNGANPQVAGHHLYRRLHESLDSSPEHLLLKTYAKRYSGASGSGQPALLPQVYLHYDPYLRPDPAHRPGAVVRQRMDFLLLLPGRRRVVLEVDGRHHYASDAGIASPSRYALMVREDRRLRLAGYEVYRFGGDEFTAPDGGTKMLEDFFTQLLDDPPAGL